MNIPFTVIGQEPGILIASHWLIALSSASPAPIGRSRHYESSGVVAVSTHVHTLLLHLSLESKFASHWLNTLCSAFPGLIGWSRNHKK